MPKYTSHYHGATRTSLGICSFKDPEGGQIILWPYLPCVRMPQKLRIRKWDGLALLQSSDDLVSIKEEEESDLKVQVFMLIPLALLEHPLQF